MLAKEEKKDKAYVDEAIKYDGLPKTIMGKYQEPSFFTLIVFIFHWSALLFESFFHIRFGIEYASPINIILIIISHIIALSVKVIPFVIMIVVGLTIYNMSYGFLLNAYRAIISFFSSGVLMVFFVSSFSLMFLHTIIAHIAYRKEKRHTYSMGVPWVYVITKLDFFRSGAYIYAFQPLIVIGIAAFLYYQVGIDEMLYIMCLGGIYLFRNFVISLKIFHAKTKIRNMEIIGDYHDKPSEDEPVEAPMQKQEGRKKSKKFEDPYED